MKAFLGLLLAIAGLVLLVACVNDAGMMLARAAARQREVAVRLALGAARGRLLRQLLVESLLLHAAAGALGLILAYVIGRAAMALLPALPVPIALDLAIDWRVLAFTAALAFAAGVLSGMVPAWQTVSTALLPMLQHDGQVGTLGRLRLRGVPVAGQVAASLLVLIVAGLLLRSLQHALVQDRGFDPRHVDVASLQLSIGGFSKATGPEFHRALRERVQALPGVPSWIISTASARHPSAVRTGSPAGPPDWRSNGTRRSSTMSPTRSLRGDRCRAPMS